MNNETLSNIEKFVNYVKTLSGDEKGEAQVFCDRLFQAFGYEGYKEAGATLEYRVKEKDKSTKFVDLFWESKLLLEMKKRGENLEKHYLQAFEYWLNATPHRPKYVVLCNFDEFWIYDLDLQLRIPVDCIKIDELVDRYTAFNFLFPENKKPQFSNNQVDVTREAADKVAQVFNSLVHRGISTEIAQKFTLQCVVALFSEDIDLLPRGLFSEILGECREGSSSFDLIGGLFRQMGSKNPAGEGSRFHSVSYFNGGIYTNVEPISLNSDEIELLISASSEKWSKVEPAIFGTLFEGSMGEKERHALGAHFTNEADIQKVVLPTIVHPWQKKIKEATTLKELINLRQELNNYKVLDPACGSGNFLYVAYRELKRIETLLITKIYENYSERKSSRVGTLSMISTKQFYGMDIKPFAVELAKVTLMLAKKLALDEENKILDVNQKMLDLEMESALPLDNLDNNIKCEDALFSEWPKVNAIIGNPPYQSKNKMQKEFSPKYIQKVRGKYSEISGMVDYCVYWFHKTHIELPNEGRAGLVGTNTIRQNESREYSLDYIINHGGTITEAVSSQVWSGDAVVHVSIVNWIKGKQNGIKKLFFQLGDNVNSPRKVVEVKNINSALSVNTDVTQAKKLLINATTPVCYQGQTHGHHGFILSIEEAKNMVNISNNNAEILFPYLTGDELLTEIPPTPKRFVIDFQSKNVLEAGKYIEPFNHIKHIVLPDRIKAAEEEKERNSEVIKGNKHHQNFLTNWWLLSYPRSELIQRINSLTRYIVCSRVTKRPIFEFIDSKIHPSDALQVFAFSDDYSFGILQSSTHWIWFKERCSTLKADFRYTSNTVFDSFPFPQSPSISNIKKVAYYANELRQLRNELMKTNNLNLREIYTSLDLPGKNPLRSIHEQLDNAVRETYNMNQTEDILSHLLILNEEVSVKESCGENVIAPGLPNIITNKKDFITNDCVTVKNII